MVTKRSIQGRVPFKGTLPYFRPIPLAVISHLKFKFLKWIKFIYYQIAPKQKELRIRATTHFEDFFIFF